MKTTKKLVGCVFAVLLFVWAAAAQTYTVTDLGVLSGDNSSWGAFINSSGQVTGCSDTSSSPSDLCAWLVPGHAFLWSSGTMQDLGTLPGDDFSFGFYVSDSHEVVGSSYNLENSTGHGFLWTKQSGKMIDLGALPGGDAYSDASAMNSKGVIVGESNVSNGNVHAVLWTLSGGNTIFMIRAICLMRLGPIPTPSTTWSRSLVTPTSTTPNTMRSSGATPRAGMT